VEKSNPINWATLVILRKTAQRKKSPKKKTIAQRKQSPSGRKFAQSGVDVMITIFGDFRQFSAKKLAFFSKTNVMI
jgi:hypothetical protein